MTHAHAHTYTLMQIPRGVFLRVAMPSLAAYGGLYAYERLMWTDRTKQRMLKDQVMPMIYA